MVELFDNKSAPICYRMGPFSNIDLRKKSGNYSIVRDVPLIQSNALYVPSGNSLPLKPNMSLEGSTNGPSVEGGNTGPKSMAMFKYNKCMPECCPATYSCSGGCICQTKKQSIFINRRGNNRT